MKRFYDWIRFYFHWSDLLFIALAITCAMLILAKALEQ